MGAEEEQFFEGYVCACVCVCTLDSEKYQPSSTSVIAILQVRKVRLCKFRRRQGWWEEDLNLGGLISSVVSVLLLCLFK